MSEARVRKVVSDFTNISPLPHLTINDANSSRYRYRLSSLLHTNHAHKQRTHIHIQVCALSISMSIPMCVYVCKYIVRYIYIYIHVFVYVNLCVIMYICVCVSMYIYIKDRDNIIQVQYVRGKQSQKTPAVIDHLFQLHILYRIHILKHNAIIDLSTVQSCLQSRL